MKTYLLIIAYLLYGATDCAAQNFQCLQYGPKHFFLNGNGYLRGIRIDSVISAADSSIYYPFHTPRGWYDESGTGELDSNGGSWLGKKVVQYPSGDWVFDNY